MAEEVPGWLASDDYESVRARVPIVCVDLIPYFAARPDPYLLISRGDGADRTPGPGWCWVGGRVRRREALASAARRHLVATLGPEVAVARADWTAPDAVTELLPVGAAIGPPGSAPRDPRMHAISLCWVIDCGGSPIAIGEAAKLGWFSAPDLGVESGRFAFGLGGVITRIVEADAARRADPIKSGGSRASKGDG